MKRPAFPVVPGLLALAFAATTLIGVWAAYDRGLASARFGLLALGLLMMLAIAWAGVRGGEPALGLIAIGCAWLAAALGVYFLMGADYAMGAAKFPALLPVGRWLQAHRPAAVLPEDVHPNVAGGALALLLPLGAGGCAWAWARGRRALGLASAPACLLGAAALLLTTSRGAWLGLAAGIAVALGFCVRPPGRWSRGSRAGALALGLCLLAVPLVAAAAGGPAVERIFGSMGDTGVALSRPAMWRDALALIGDYPFTGSGPASTALTYSSYGLLIHAPYVWQMHNLFLQAAVEQGLPGLLVLVALLAAALWGLLASPRREFPGWLWLGAIASLVTLGVNGVVDAGLYGSKAVVIFFVPIGVAFGQAEPGAYGTFGGKAFTALGVVLLALAGALLLPGVRGAFQANIGAVLQARVELPALGGPDSPIQDAVRQSPAVDLAPAEARYGAALAMDPGNVTANRRLGQIELSRGQYEAARTHMAAAYASAAWQRPTRLLLGESYAAAGAVTEAARLWSGLEGTDVALAERAWWYGQLGDVQRQAWVDEAARLAAGNNARQ